MKARDIWKLSKIVYFVLFNNTGCPYNTKKAMVPVGTRQNLVDGMVSQ
jgi:hypothetical protein